MRQDDFDGKSVSNLLLYKLEDGSWSMDYIYNYRPEDKYFVRYSNYVQLKLI